MHTRNDTTYAKPIRRYAAIIALVYLAVTCVWVYVSSVWVIRLAAGDPERLALLQRYKAFGFMIVTAIGIYISLLAVMRRTAEATNALNETRERWAEAERQAAPALLASCIAHDVANLLTVMRLNLEKLQRLEGPSRDAVARLDNGVDRLNELVKRLRGASTSLFQDRPVNFDFTKAVEETVAFMSSHVCCVDVDVTVQTSGRAPLFGYPVLAHQLVMNLLINAAEATGRTGQVRFTVSTVSGDGTAGGACDGVTLSVEDDGPGIEPPLRAKVLGAFFTTKATGSGLGLSSVRSCVEIHKGTMKIDDSPDLGGARFTLTLPNLTAERFEELRYPFVRSGGLGAGARSPGISISTQGHLKAVPDAEVPMAPVDSILT